MSGLIALLRSGWRSLYFLMILMIAYILNQLDRYTIGVVSQPMAKDLHFGDKGCMISNISFRKFKHFCRFEYGSSTILERSERSCLNKTKANIRVCSFDYDGTGFQYQILVGPAFIVIYTISGVPLGLLGNYVKRKYLLAVCVIIWSLATILTGVTKSYMELLSVRFITGIGEAGCTPLATSMISDYFSEDLHGAALGIYNWGIYIGYSLSYTLGNYITELNINNQGWRWVFFLAGMPGVIVGFLILFTFKEPHRRDSHGFKGIKNGHSKPNFSQTFMVLLKTSLQPSTLILFLAGTIRNAGGYVWAYNTQPYFNLYHPDVDVAAYMSWIPLVGGSLGVLLGGFISDRVFVSKGPHARIWVLVLSQIIASPFAAGALYFDPPLAFISLIPSTVIGEMWIGVTLAVVIELVPNVIRTAYIAWYVFIVTVIAGNVPLLVPVLSQWTSLKIALYVLFPGLYAASSVFFLLSLVVVKLDNASRERLSLMHSRSCGKTSRSDEKEALLNSSKVA